MIALISYLESPGETTSRCRTKTMVARTVGVAFLASSALVPESYALTIPYRNGRNGGAVLVPATSSGTRVSAFVGIRPARPPLQLSSSPAGDEAISAEEKLDQFLSSNDLRPAIRHLKSHPDLELDGERIIEIFHAIEIRTAEAEENNINTRAAAMEGLEYPPESPARSEMTQMYRTLQNLSHLKLFGAAGRDENPYPAMGSKVVTPVLLEEITELSMLSLTPKPTNTLLYAGGGLAIVEGFISLNTGLDLNFLFLATLFLAGLDQLLVNGAVVETAMRIVMPEYGRKILRHEAGHFLCAYLLGCPVEGCVLSSWAALKDARFGGRRTTVSAGTSFFDPELSDEINGKSALTRNSIDRYSVVVMGGIAAEALNFGRADGGAGDEQALVQFLTSVNPRGGGAQVWNADRIKNQARWGAMQAVLLLRQYRVCYDALVDALERGGDLGMCVWAIEKAARDNDLQPMKAPLGYLRDKGPYGQWATAPADIREDKFSAVAVEGTTIPNDLSEQNKGDNGRSNPLKESLPPDEIISSKELLSQYRQAMTEKLKKIDEQLNDINEGEAE